MTVRTRGVARAPSSEDSATMARSNDQGGHNEHDRYAHGVERQDGAPNVDLKLEVTVIPVSDVDRAKAFYTRLGWRLDADFAFDNGFRVVQFTPPGSAASVQFGAK